MIFLDDKELIENLREKNQYAFIEVVEQYKNKIASMCYSFTEDYGEAEDLSQEVFISLFKSINNFREECSLSTYIYKITTSKCMDYKKKKSIKGFLKGLISTYPENYSGITIDDKAYIRQCINLLSKDIKTCIILYYYVGFSFKEIVEILSITERAVEGKIYRGKQKIKEKMKKEGFQQCQSSGMI